MKATTGSGDPCTGQEFRDSSKRMAKVVETLIHAEPHKDRWDGTASQVYNATNASHRRLASEVQAADLAIADVIDIEAGQVTRTRQTLDDTSDTLTNYDLATMWMNATPPTRAVKFALDCTAAVGALDVAGATMAVLVKNSLENADRIRKPSTLYGDAAKETPLPGTGENKLPTRSKPDEPYTVPEPEEPTVQAPATPYGAPAPGAPR
jgi:hypothetical protein